jgi:hypothetical protein
VLRGYLRLLELFLNQNTKLGWKDNFLGSRHNCLTDGFFFVKNLFSSVKSPGSSRKSIIFFWKSQKQYFYYLRKLRVQKVICRFYFIIFTLALYLCQRTIIKNEGPYSFSFYDFIRFSSIV